MDRVGDLLRAVSGAPTVDRAKELAEELVRTVVTLYGDGLERVLEIVHETAGDRSEAIFTALCGDAFVENLLALHGLHPHAIEDRIQLALDSIRPYLESHEGNVELVRVEDDVAYVRLAGSCDGCHASAATLKNAVETAILERVGEIREVRAESGTPAPDTSVGGGSLALHSDWVALDELPELAARGLAHVRCSGSPVLIVEHAGTVYAYRDRCPACTSALEGAFLAWPFVRCALCGARFDVVRAGRVVDDERRSAEPFPVIRDGRRVRVAIAVEA